MLRGRRPAARRLHHGEPSEQRHAPPPQRAGRSSPPRVAPVHAEPCFSSVPLPGTRVELAELRPRPRGPSGSARCSP
eukprot:9316302-Pyramimonas_sp.AAC.1